MPCQEGVGGDEWGAGQGRGEEVPRQHAPVGLHRDRPACAACIASGSGPSPPPRLSHIADELLEALPLGLNHIWLCAILGAEVLQRIDHLMHLPTRLLPAAHLARPCLPQVCWQRQRQRRLGPPRASVVLPNAGGLQEQKCRQAGVAVPGAAGFPPPPPPGTAAQLSQGMAILCSGISPPPPRLYPPAVLDRSSVHHPS